MGSEKLTLRYADFPSPLCVQCKVQLFPVPNSAVDHGDHITGAFNCNRCMKQIEINIPVKTVEAEKL